MDDILEPYIRQGEVLDHLSAGLLIISLDKTILYANRTVGWIAGKDKENIIGRPCVEALHGPFCDDSCHIRQSRDGGSLNKKKDSQAGGEPLDISRYLTPIPGPKGEPIAYLEVFQDHSAFRDLLVRVRHEDRRLKAILDTLETGVLTVDRGGHITFFNAMAETLTGYDRKDILGKHFSLLFANRVSPDVYLLQKTIADGKARKSREGVLKTRQGEQIPIRARYMAMKNEQGRVTGGMATLTDLSLVYQLQGAIKDRYTFFDMVGRSPAMEKLFEIVPVVAASDATVLVEGQTGTGKDLLAKVIHNQSSRAKSPLVKVNCAALPDNLLESEMFGYTKGAFTGAEKDKPGRFQEADGGTLFLDEIGEMPLALQAKLLRVLEDKEFYPLGGRKVVKVDVRILAATNRDLPLRVREKKFREDLFYRLNVVRLELPALKDRKGDLPLLVSHILRRLCATRETSVEKISDKAMKVLLDHDYPGNVRELENILEHALILCRGSVIELAHLPLTFQTGGIGETPPLGVKSFSQARDEREKEHILEVLEHCQGNKGEAASRLNMHRATLWRKMKKYGLA